jgi:Ni,Fe-hydrogenase III small subunit
MKDIFYEELERVFDKFPKYHINILLGDCAKVSGENYFQTNKWEREFKRNQQ